MALLLLDCVYGNLVIPQRYIMVIMMLLAMFNAYNMRVVYNLAITEMIQDINDTTVIDTCPQYIYEKSYIGAKFIWKHELESLSLYAFYIGYMVSHVPGGFLADKYGGRPVMCVCMIVSIIINSLFPFGISYIGDGQITAIVLRALLGFSQGPIIPCVSSFLQRWVPLEERAFLVALAFSGSYLGTVIGSTLTGVIIKQTESWQIPFYFWGVVAIIWCIFHILYVFSYPETHPHITKEELEYLELSIGEHQKFKVPWLEICKSLPSWALLVAQFGHNFLFLTLITYLPKYLKEILKMDVQANAAFTALPFLMLWISTALFGYVADIITNRKVMSVTFARKLYTSFAAIAPSCCLILVSYVGCNRIAAISLYTLAMFLQGPFLSGSIVNVNDLTKHFGGTIMAFVNSIGVSAGIIGPWIVGALTTDKSLESWHLVFWILLGVALGTSLFYIVFGKGERQYWDHIEDEL